MMKRSALFAIALVCALALALLWNSKGKLRSRSASSATTRTSTAGSRPSSRLSTTSATASSDNSPPAPKTSAPPLSLASNTLTQQRAAAADPQLLAVKQILHDYRAALGEDPVGTNSEITKALLGANSRKARFTSDEARIDKGRLIDRWNHPYFFHQLSRSQMQIRSAGPDGKMWTADDELSR